MNDQPSNYPTTSDISQFMGDLNFKWSNQAQIYFKDNGAKYEHLSGPVAEHLYLKLIGNKPYDCLPTITSRQVNL